MLGQCPRTRACWWASEDLNLLCLAVDGLIAYREYLMFKNKSSIECIFFLHEMTIFCATLIIMEIKRCTERRKLVQSEIRLNPSNLESTKAFIRAGLDRYVHQTHALGHHPRNHVTLTNETCEIRLDNAWYSGVTSLACNNKCLKFSMVVTSMSGSRSEK